MIKNNKWVFAFDEFDEAEQHVGGDREKVRGLLGGKGANLLEMTHLGIPVPPGFTISTEACNAYLQADGEFPDSLWDQALTALHYVEEKAGKKFGDPRNPLLVSSRSGAKFSMPGMMDTVLNIGLNDEVVVGLIERTQDSRFVCDSYRRLVQMFGAVVLGVPDEPFEEVLTRYRTESGVETDAELKVEDLKAVVEEFKGIIKRMARREFPTDPYEQLRLAIEAVFHSWNGKRARDYRNAAHIPHDLGTAVNIQTMVFGNMGGDSATGVAMSRNATTGENRIEGDYLINAQGEDVVAGIRATIPIERLEEDMPEMYRQFTQFAKQLENHYRDMQDMEFTIEHGKLWLLQTRNAKRTAQAAVRIAVEMAEEGLITQEEALLGIEASQIDAFLHPQFSVDSKKQALDSGAQLASGLNVSPGAATGVIAFDADLAECWAKEEGKEVIMVRPETKPDDVHGMLAAEGILTSRGGRTSHAALVARQFGKPAIVGVAELDIDMVNRSMTVGNRLVQEGEWISIDGATGEVFIGKLEKKVPDIEDPWLSKLLGWADERRQLQIWTNADYPHDADRGRRYGAQGIGLCRTEHMFFEPDRLPYVQQMIMAKSAAREREALSLLMPFQRDDFAGLFRVMDGLPVIIRLIDPPLHEFLTSYEELTRELADLKIRLTAASNLEAMDGLLKKIERDQHLLERVEALRESNPMLGLRGVRLGIMRPRLTRMQVRAIFAAACQVTREGVDVHPEIMIPLVSHVNELRRQREVLEAEARAVMDEYEVEVSYKFGTMIEIPRAAVTADQIAECAEFFSFGTNDLTQTTYGISRDDAESGFLIQYLEQGILPENPFASLDEDGVGKLMGMAVKLGKETRPDVEIGLCGEHGGDSKSIDICHRLGLKYVSCSPFRVPIARLAAAQSAIRNNTQ